MNRKTNIEEFHADGNVWELMDGVVIQDENNVNHQVIKLKEDKENTQGYVQILCVKEIKKAKFLSSFMCEKDNIVVDCKECINVRKNKLKRFHEIFQVIEDPNNEDVDLDIEDFHFPYSQTKNVDLKELEKHIIKRLNKKTS